MAKRQKTVPANRLLTGGVIVRALMNQVISAAMTRAHVTPRRAVIRF